MAAYIFFYNPMSRAQIARWALHEVAADYESVFVAWDNKPAALMDANPMGKIPTIIHHTTAGDHVVSEAAAVCHYLAATSSTGLVPDASEMADYFRWMFFAAGPLEAAVTNRSLGFDVPAEKTRMAGYGTYADVMDTLEKAVSANAFIAGDRFSAADVYVGSHIAWGLNFGSIDKRSAFVDYFGRVSDRDAYRRAGDLDNAAMKAA